MSHTNSDSVVKQALLAVERMKAKLETAERKQKEPIAIIGAACRFPGEVNSPAEFWRLLQDGVHAVGRIPDERWPVAAYYDADPAVPGKSYAAHGGFIDDVSLFDAAFFSIAPVEAITMDPQQRLLLELSWAALEDAAIPPDSLRGSRTGVFVGICSSDYSLSTLASHQVEKIDAFAGTGAAASVAAGRLSYFYGLHGPSFPVDTACSSSLLAAHLACQSLRLGECDLAVVAGVNLILAPDLHVYFSKTRALSANGRCRAFDAAADGYVRGEGCGVVILKRLSEALAAGDNVVAVIRGSAVNHDGRSSGLTAPNGPAQQAVIRQALANGGVAPHEVSYVEAHGTGTPLGDPIEAQALAAVYGENRPADKPLWIGSVKTNIGHLEGAAGIAGLIKTALALRQGEIPPQLNYSQPNPHIPWADLPVKVATEKWPFPPDQPRLAGLSSFGFSGTNVHFVLAAADAPPERQPEAVNRPHLFVLSAKRPPSLAALVVHYADYLAAHPELPLGDICHTTAVGRSHFPHRLALVCRDRVELLAALNSEKLKVGSEKLTTNSRQRPRVVFQFTGQGAQYAGMGQPLYDRYPVFRQALDECDALLRPYLPQHLLPIMFGEAGTGDNALDETVYTQPALFAFEYALARLWQSWGVEATAVIGHSIGEYVAACLAGVFSLADGLKLVAARGRLMQALPQDGAMLVAFAAEAETTPFLDGLPQIAVAVVNGPDNVVISGKRESVAAVGERLDEAGIITRPLRVSHAFHSPLMEPILAEFREIAGQISYAAPQIPLISNVSGRFFAPGIASGDAPDADYWTDHIRQPVRYFAGLEALLAQENNPLVLEIGPKPILTDLGQRYLATAAAWLASADPEREERLLESLAACYTAGVAVDWHDLYPRGPYRPVVLPTYAFDRKRFWVENDPAPVTAVAPAAPNNDELFNAFVDVLV
jgi:acyl transferase domain-containing protein